MKSLYYVQSYFLYGPQNGKKSWICCQLNFMLLRLISVILVSNFGCGSNQKECFVCYLLDSSSFNFSVTCNLIICPLAYSSDRFPLIYFFVVPLTKRLLDLCLLVFKCLECFFFVFVVQICSHVSFVGRQSFQRASSETGLSLFIWHKGISWIEVAILFKEDV